MCVDKQSATGVDGVRVNTWEAPTLYLGVDVLYEVAADSEQSGAMVSDWTCLSKYECVAVQSTYSMSTNFKSLLHLWSKIWTDA